MMIHWCEICNHQKSDGVLEVLRKGEVKPTFIQACQDCVDKIDDSEWL